MTEGLTLNQQIQFRCACGALFHSPVSAAGHPVPCKECGSSIGISPVETSQGSGTAKQSSIAPSVFPEADFWPDRDNNNKVDRPKSASPVEEPNREATDQLCSICQTLIRPSDASTNCAECSLPFHEGVLGGKPWLFCVRVSKRQFIEIGT